MKYHDYTTSPYCYFYARKFSALVLIVSFLLPMINSNDVEARVTSRSRARSSDSGDGETSGDGTRGRPRRGVPGVYVDSELQARHAENIDPAAVCTQAQAMMHTLQTQLGDMGTKASGTVPSEKYKDLIKTYNQEVSRFALFDGVNKVINQYRSVVDRAIEEPSATPDESGRIRDMAAIGNIVALQGSIDQILTEGIRITELATRFPDGVVCPAQDVTSSTIITCDATTRIPVIYRALEQKCSGAPPADTIRTSPMCQTLTTLRTGSNTQVRTQVSDVLSGFYTSYVHAYNVGLPEATVSAEQAREDLRALNARLTTLGTANLTIGSNTKRGMAILSNQMDSFNLRHLRVREMDRIYRECLNDPSQIPGGSTACVTCYESNASACLPETQPTSGPFSAPRVSAVAYTGMRAQGLRTNIEQASIEANREIGASFDSSPLLRAAVSGYRVTRATGAPTDDPGPPPGPANPDAPAEVNPTPPVPTETPPDTVSLASASEAKTQFNDDYKARFLDQNDRLKTSRVDGATSINRSLSSIVGTNEYNELKANLIRGRNQALLQDAAYRGQNLSEVKGLLKESDFSDDKTFHFEMLQNLLALTTVEPATARVTLNCIRQGPAADSAPMNISQLTALRNATGNGLADKFRSCMQELNDDSSKRDKFSAQKNASQARLSAIQAKINSIEQGDGYRHKLALQQHVSSIAQTACTRTENRMKRMSCDLNDTAALSEVEFFIAHNGQIISSINRGVASPTADLLGQLKGMRYFCAQALGGDASSHPALCNAGFAAAPTAPLVSRREEELVAENRRLLDENYEENDSRYGMSPSGEKRGTVLRSSLLGTAGTTLGGLGSLWVGSMAFDSNLALMEQQAIQMKTFQAFANSTPFPAYPFGFSPVSAPFNGTGGFIVAPGSVPASGGYNAYFNVGV